MERIKLTFGDKKVIYESKILEEQSLARNLRTGSEMFENYQKTIANHQQTQIKNLVSEFNIRKKEERATADLEYMKERLYSTFGVPPMNFNAKLNLTDIDT
jgi:hypothetical protein